MRWGLGVVVWLALALAAGCAGPACGDASGADPTGTSQGPGDPAESPIVVAAGDIACGHCAQHQTADLIQALDAEHPLSAVLVLGDAAYRDGLLEEYLTHYAPAWGRAPLRAITRPALGGHDYLASRDRAAGYFDYFYGPGVERGPFGARAEGYYSYRLGEWHVIVLNTGIGCEPVACDEGSAQLAWLVAELAANPTRCTLAYFHDPRFQTGREHGDFGGAGPIWSALYRAGADVVLGGHEHNYQQLAPLDDLGRLDRARGIRSFVVGTGGAPLYTKFGDEHAEAVEARQAEHHGVLELTLHPTRFEWRFVAVGGAVLAAGEDDCH